jgi:hypothetical protein
MQRFYVWGKLSPNLELKNIDFSNKAKIRQILKDFRFLFIFLVSQIAIFL